MAVKYIADEPTLDRTVRALLALDADGVSLRARPVNLLGWLPLLHRIPNVSPASQPPY